MTEDLQTWKPAVVLVKLCRPEGICQAMTGVPFDMLGWFLKDPAFTAEWANYRKRTGDGYYDVYTRTHSTTVTTVNPAGDVETRTKTTVIETK